MSGVGPLVTAGFLAGSLGLLVTAGYGSGAAAATYNPDIELTLTINRTVALTGTINRTVSDDAEVP